MNAITLSLPIGAVQKGQLYEAYDITELDQDIIEIDLPSGATIEAGWYPEYDRTGRFQITVFRDFWENRLAEPFAVKTVIELARFIEALAFWFSVPPANPIGGSGVSYTTTRSTSAVSAMVTA